MSQKQSTGTIVPNQRHTVLSQNFSETETETESVPDPNDDDPFIVGKGKGKSARGTNTNVNTTPSTRIPKKDQKSMSGAAKKRVDKATAGGKLAGSRCVVENTSEDNAVEYAHCFPRGTRDDILDNLEYSWGLNFQTLNLDTRYNIFRLSAKFHSLFDKGLWILVPEANIVNTYLNGLPKENSGRPEKLPELSQRPPYKYTLVAHPTMQAVPLLRQKSDSINQQTNNNVDRILTTKDFNFLEYPFSGTIIISHIHPRFAICNIGWIFGKRAKLLTGYSYSNQITNITTIVHVYTSWINLYQQHLEEKLPDALIFKFNGVAGESKGVKTDNNSIETALMRAISSTQQPHSQNNDNNQRYNLRSQNQPLTQR